MVTGSHHLNCENTVCTKTHARAIAGTREPVWGNPTPNTSNRISARSSTHITG